MVRRFTAAFLEKDEGQLSAAVDAYLAWALGVDCRDSPHFVAADDEECLANWENKYGKDGPRWSLGPEGYCRACPCKPEDTALLSYGRAKDPPFGRRNAEEFVRQAARAAELDDVWTPSVSRIEPREVVDVVLGGSIAVEISPSRSPNLQGSILDLLRYPSEKKLLVVYPAERGRKNPLEVVDDILKSIGKQGAIECFLIDPWNRDDRPLSRMMRDLAAKV